MTTLVPLFTLCESPIAKHLGYHTFHTLKYKWMWASSTSPLSKTIFSFFSSSWVAEWSFLHFHSYSPSLLAGFRDTFRSSSKSIILLSLNFEKSVMCSSTALVALVLAAGQFFLLANAHIEMMSPIPFRSKYLPNPGPDTDYSMTSPLNQDGSNFPCKGYQNDSLAPTATLTAGSSFMLAYLFPSALLSEMLMCSGWMGVQHIMVGHVNFRWVTMEDKLGLYSIRSLVDVLSILRIILFQSLQIFLPVQELFWHGVGKITLEIGNYTLPTVDW